MLFVDDEPDFRELIEEALDLYGFDVVAVGDVEAALAQVEATTPDAVVTDFVLGGRDGGQLAERLAELLPDLPVILVSGDPSQVGDAFAGPKREVLAKPVDIGTLADTLHTLIG